MFNFLSRLWNPKPAGNTTTAVDEREAEAHQALVSQVAELHWREGVSRPPAIIETEKLVTVIYFDNPGDSDAAQAESVPLIESRGGVRFIEDKDDWNAIQIFSENLGPEQINPKRT